MEPDFGFSIPVFLYLALETKNSAAFSCVLGTDGLTGNFKSKKSKSKKSNTGFNSFVRNASGNLKLSLFFSTL